MKSKDGCLGVDARLHERSSSRYPRYVLRGVRRSALSSVRRFVFYCYKYITVVLHLNGNEGSAVDCGFVIQYNCKGR